MLTDAVSQRLTQLELVPVAIGASDALLRNRDEEFVNNSVAKSLPKDVARQFAQLAAAERLDALIVLAPGLNNSSQAGRRHLQEGSARLSARLGIRNRRPQRASPCSST